MEYILTDAEEYELTDTEYWALIDDVKNLWDELGDLEKDFNPYNNQLLILCNERCYKAIVRYIKESGKKMKLRERGSYTFDDNFIDLNGADVIYFPGLMRNYIIVKILRSKFY